MYFFLLQIVNFQNNIERGVKNKKKKSKIIPLHEKYYLFIQKGFLIMSVASMGFKKIK